MGNLYPTNIPNCQVFVSTILVTWIISALIFNKIKLRRKEKLLKGSIDVECDIKKDEYDAPCTQISRILATSTIGLSSALFIFTIISCFLNLWDRFPQYIALDFPSWVNWIGLIGIWMCYAWGIAVMAYNINYGPLFKRLEGKYVLATGGLYKYLKHPMYTEKIIVLIFVFLATGIWLAIIGVIGATMINKQAVHEEQLLLMIFKEKYEDFMKNTGRFFPKFKSATKS